MPPAASALEVPRQKPDVIIADVDLRQPRSPYMRYGDWFAGLCLACSVFVVIIGWRRST